MSLNSDMFIDFRLFGLRNLCVRFSKLLQVRLVTSAISNAGTHLASQIPWIRKILLFVSVRVEEAASCCSWPGACGCTPELQIGHEIDSCPYFEETLEFRTTVFLALHVINIQYTHRYVYIYICTCTNKSRERERELPPSPP